MSPIIEPDWTLKAKEKWTNRDDWVLSVWFAMIAACCVVVPILLVLVWWLT
jgi:hypothetical protein